MSEKVIVNEVTNLLLQIKNKFQNKGRTVKRLEAFLLSVPVEDKLWDSQTGQILAEFKYTLAYHQPNRFIRWTNDGLFGDDQLLVVVDALLDNLESQPG